jgi:hypothetical protein
MTDLRNTLKFNLRYPNANLYRVKQYFVEYEEPYIPSLTVYCSDEDVVYDTGLVSPDGEPILGFEEREPLGFIHFK